MFREYYLYTIEEDYYRLNIFYSIDFALESALIYVITFEFCVEEGMQKQMKSLDGDPKQIILRKENNLRNNPWKLWEKIIVYKIT